MTEPRIRLGMVGGGEDAFIGAVHRIAAQLDDRYELVAGVLSASPKGDAFGSSSRPTVYRPYPDFRISRRQRLHELTPSKRLRSSRQTTCTPPSLRPSWRQVFISSATNR